MNKMRMQDIYRVLYPYLPNCSFGEDNEGQVIIYTDTYEDSDGYLSTMPTLED